jgi:uncharacterized protein (TIGR02722 family)
MSKYFSLILVVAALGISSCGPKAFTKGEYDDPTKVRLLDDKFNEADMQQMAEAIVQAMVACDEIKNARKPPMVIMEKVQNRTEEHIDMKALTDKIRTELSKSKKVKFIAKEDRSTLKEEYDYNEDGYTSEETKKKKGKQIGGDYIFSGSMATNIQEVGEDKLIYYKLTMNLVNVDTSVIDCTEEKEVRKKYRKQTY